MRTTLRSCYCLAFMLACAVAMPITAFSIVDRDRVEAADFSKTVSIVFSGTSATVTDKDGAGVVITRGETDSAVSITSTADNVAYVISGSSSSGYLQVTSTYRCEIVLNGVSLSAGDGPALSVLTSADTYLVLEKGTTNTLADSASYTRTGKGTIHTGGAMLVSGKGSLNLTSNGGHGIFTTGYLRIFGGNITVTGAAKDAIHPKTYFRIDGGELTLTATEDGIDAASGIIQNGGRIAFTSAEADVKGVKTDGNIEIYGGTLTATISGNQSKALSASGNITIGGGALFLNLSGDVVLESATTDDGTAYSDLSYCTGIKSDADLTVTGGNIAITHSGMAGKGVSVDGNIVMSGGTFDITTSCGVSSSYTNEDGELDMASADGFKTDGNLTITGGTLNVTSTGKGGDAISCDGAAVIGVTGVDSTPVISANTKGEHVLLSGSDYVNAKAFKAEGNLTMNGGYFTATTTTDGGEGMESKANLVINGGTIEITSYDDAINAATNITINGGNIYCYSSGNDGIDSNGTLTINGGTIVSSGTNAPEEGFDCDNNTFTITGGTLVGTGGGTSTPTSKTCTQRSVIYSGTGTSSTVLQIKSSSGNVLVYKLPRSYSGSMTLLFSSSDLDSGTSYTIVSGATISSGTEFHGLYTGATVSGGTTLKTFTPSSMVNTVR